MAGKLQLEPGHAGLDDGNQNLPQSTNTADDPAKPSRDEMEAEIQKIFTELAGIRDGKLAELLVTQMRALQVWVLQENEVHRVFQAAFTLQELGPKNATEAMLAIQMFGVHNSAVVFLHRAIAEGQTFDGTDANVLRATRLMRLFTEQLQAMAKLKGKAGRQKVTVEHVHVHRGGQAIVGSVETSGPAGHEKDPDVR